MHLIFIRCARSAPYLGAPCVSGDIPCNPGDCAVLRCVRSSHLRGTIRSNVGGLLLRYNSRGMRCLVNRAAGRPATAAAQPLLPVSPLPPCSSRPQPWLRSQSVLWHCLWPCCLLLPVGHWVSAGRSHSCMQLQCAAAMVPDVDHPPTDQSWPHGMLQATRRYMPIELSEGGADWVQRACSQPM
jgi:hypothetical protein